MGSDGEYKCHELKKVMINQTVPGVLDTNRMIRKLLM